MKKNTKQDLASALRDLIAFYDRVAGNVYTGHGWTPAEMKRLQEIRDLVNRQQEGKT